MVASCRLAGLAAALVMVGSPAWPQAWPNRPVTMVVPFAAGGAVDLMGRILSPALSQLLGQQVVVENIGGAGGMTGAARVAKAPPDGYQFVLGNAGTHAVNQTLYKQPLYNAATDFAPAAMVAETYWVLIVRKDLPATTFPEFIAYAKANQAKMQFGSAGAGSSTHMAATILNMAMGVSVTHVPYRGIGLAMQDLMAGRIDFTCEPISTAVPQIRGNTVKAIAILGPRRTQLLPGLPTAAEYGYPELAISGWNALFLPKGTPEAIVLRLSRAAIESVETPSVVERIEGIGYNVPPPDRRTPEFLAKFVPAEIEKWGKVIKAGGISAD